MAVTFLLLVLLISLVVVACLIRCDDVFPLQKISTYINYSRNQESFIDYELGSQGCVINNFIVLDPEINFSDHLPYVTIKCTSPTCSDKGSSRGCRTSNTLSASQYGYAGIKLIAVHITISPVNLLRSTFRTRTRCCCQCCFVV